MFSEFDVQCMQQALELAKTAALNQEVPVGAVLALNEKIIAGAANSPITLHDPSAHAEVLTLRAAAQQVGNYRLIDTTLYVTLEPCVMCVGAIVHARVKRVVYGAADPKTGAVSSMFQLGQSSQFNHRVNYVGGLLADECGGVLKSFFQNRR